MSTDTACPSLSTSCRRPPAGTTIGCVCDPSTGPVVDAGGELVPIKAGPHAINASRVEQFSTALLGFLAR